MSLLQSERDAAVFHSGAAAVSGGNFGAFIKIRSAIPSRRALFDIGLAGPLAGFVVALPIAVIGVLTVGAPLDRRITGSSSTIRYCFG